ncbi:MAG: asparagine synthetase B [Candidatus Bathyarchaeia archaeon]
MGSIVGLIDREGFGVGEKIVEMLRILQHRGPDAFGVASEDTFQVEKSLEDLDVREVDAPIAVGCNALNLTDKPGEMEIPVYSIDGIVKVQEGEVYSEAPVFKQKDDLSSECVKVARDLRGAYAFALLCGDKIYLTCDSIGAKPIFLGENDRYVGFASERKALWRVGINNTRIIQAGTVAVLGAGGISTLPAPPIVEGALRYFDMESAVKEVQPVLKAACKVRVYPEAKRIGVLFSGGLDSSLIAYVLRELGLEVVLYVGGLDGSCDVEAARCSADELGFELREASISLDEFEECICRVVYAIESFNSVNVGVALPIYLASRMAREDGLRLCFSGQGCDELFGGYSRYLNVLSESGYEGLQAVLWRDVGRLSEGAQRDGAAALANSVELRSPFIDRDLIDVVMGISPELKVAGTNDKLRKLVLRRLAKELGLPESIVVRVKKAAQYGSGAEKALKMLAKEKGFSVDSMLQKIYVKFKYMVERCVNVPQLRDAWLLT